MAGIINGGHIILYSKNAAADKKFLQNVMKLPHVDIGDGWLVFGMPPCDFAILAATPEKQNGKTEFHFTCPNISTFQREMEAQKIECSPIEDHGWGLVVRITLPGGSEVGVFQARYKRPPQMDENNVKHASEPLCMATARLEEA